MTNRTDAPPPPSDPKTLLKELRKIYAKSSLKEDYFGRRQALPGEIERVIKARAAE